MPRSLAVTILISACTGASSAAIIHLDPPDLAVRVQSVPPMFTVTVDAAPFDLDRDGIDDLQIAVSRAQFFITRDVAAWIEPVRSGPAAAVDGLEATRFTPPQPVGASPQSYSSDPAYLALSDTSATTWYGQWSGGDTGIAGVRFDRQGVDHFAWLRLRFDVSMPDLLPTLTLLDWAWEDQPGVPIAAGAVPVPGALAAMALWAGLAAGRGHRATRECHP